jgi:hypothetical protein
MCAIPKRASKERIKAEFTSLMVDKYEEYDQIYTDGSLKDENSLSLQITKLSKKDKTPILNIHSRTACDHNGNRKYNTNEQTDDHSHELT